MDNSGGLQRHMWGSVLVVDDEPCIRSAVGRMLRGLPLRLRFAGSAEEALPMIDVEVPDLVISDFNMPGIDGLTFIRKVLDRHQSVRVVLHTGSSLQAIPLDIVLAPKPCAAATLRALVVQLLRGEPGGDLNSRLRTG